MTRVRRLVVVVIAAIGVILILGGAALVVADAQSRTAAAQQVVDELVDYYATQDGYEVGNRETLLRSIVADSIANDGPLPDLATEPNRNFLGATYGAFGGVFSYIPLERPWAARLIVAPVAVGGVLLATALLVAAAGWSPRQRVGGDPA
ncbi:hypothetical protein [Labedella endophytica]|uniref:Uncharacterized protein n=1 Tax=Labedella endophytica TaxID=1523160 RepID=A0A3S1CSZ6_9MICO|nr:hypothetical protein [Labedella endophytica]RUR01779.1 hypothetical protein ELQ94_10010 [Labedella endophytica]